MELSTLFQPVKQSILRGMGLLEIDRLKAQLVREQTKLQRLQTQQNALAKILKKIRASIDLDELIKTTTREACEYLKVERVAIYRFNPDWSGQFIGDFGFAQNDWNQVAPFGEKLLWIDSHLQETRGGRYRANETFAVADIYQAGHSPCHVDILEQFKIRAYAIAPIFNGFQLWGLLAAYQHSGPRDWEDNELAFLAQVGSHLGIAIQQSALLIESQQRANDLQQAITRQRALTEVVNRIRSSLDTKIILQTTCQEARELLAVERVAVYQFHENWSGEFVEHFGAVDAQWQDLAPLGQNLVWEDTYLQETKGGRYQRNETFTVEDIYQAGHTQCHIDLLEQFKIRAYAIVPIFIGRRLWGLLAAYQHSAPRVWQALEVEFLAQIATQMGIVLEQANLLTQSQQQAEQLSEALHTTQAAQMQLVQAEKMASLGQLVAGVAHEINNPVNFIHGNLDHIKNYSHELLNLVRLYQEAYPESSPAIQAAIDQLDLEFVNEDLPKMIGSMQVGTHRIRDIILSLRNFSRLDESEIKSVNIHEGLDSTLMILSNRLKRNPNHTGIQVYKEYADLPLVECYPGQINQVFMYILINALDALEERDHHRSPAELKANPSFLKLSTRLVSNQIIAIHLANNGPAISEEIQAKLFNPFFTTKTPSKGTGLGLSISHQIITEQHGGKLSVVSSPNQGTEFVIELPIALAHRPA